MTNPYIATTPRQEQEMLEAAGAGSIKELFAAQIPSEFLDDVTFEMPRALSEPELHREFGRLAGQNRPTSDVVSFLGGGVYDHFIPAAVGLVANRAEFVTAYTPYQPEASQGTLQAFFEYQTVMARLYGMDVSNASLYDAASALGEAMYLALAAKPERSAVVLPESLHPDCRRTVETYLRYFDTEIRTVACPGGCVDASALGKALDGKVAALAFQTPNYFGAIEDGAGLVKMAHDAGALAIAVADPISLGLLEAPGVYGADVAIGEGQPLGLRQFAGGETLGIFTCKKEFLRRVPGRLVGAARDKFGRRGFVLTLQTREQHIRRDKATSNICTNHAHNALRATIYLSLMGPAGLRQVARACVRGLDRLRGKLGGAVAFDAPSFKEITVKTAGPAAEAARALVADGFYAGVPLGHMGARHENHLLVCVTEKRTDAEIDAFADALKRFV